MNAVRREGGAAPWGVALQTPRVFSREASLEHSGPFLLVMGNSAQLLISVILGSEVTRENPTPAITSSPLGLTGWLL